MSSIKHFFQVYYSQYEEVIAGRVHARNCHGKFSIKKGVLKHFTEFTGKHLCQSLFFNKVAGLRPHTFFTEHLQTTASPMLIVVAYLNPLMSFTICNNKV